MALRSIQLAVVAIFAVLCCLASVSQAQSVAAGRFALNGRTNVSSGSDQVDWADIYNGQYQPFSSVFVKDYYDPPVKGTQRDPSSWHQGKSKDTEDIPDWKWTPSLNSNDKGNILNAYATVITEDNRAAIYFGLDREAPNGVATAGFWFLQDPNFGLGGAINNVAYQFNGKHIDGDLLVVADFPGQGTGAPATIKVFMWRAGNLSQIINIDSNAGCDPNNVDQVICAITNDVEEISSPWYFNGKFTQGYTIPARSFVEGGLLVSSLVGKNGIERLPCYSSFLATTRVSNQINSVSEDFATGQINQCGLVFESECLGGRQYVSDEVLNSTTVFTRAPFEWDYSVTLTNLGYNDIENVVIKLNDDVVFDVGILRSKETFFDNGTIPTNTSSIHMIFEAQGTGHLAYTLIDEDNPCSDPVYVPGGLTPGEKAAIAVGSIVGAAIAAAAVGGLIAGGFLLMKNINPAPPPEELIAAEMTTQGSDTAGVNSLFQDSVIEGENPMFNSPTNV